MLIIGEMLIVGEALAKNVLLIRIRSAWDRCA
jgi:hypothetical protein